MGRDHRENGDGVVALTIPARAEYIAAWNARLRPALRLSEAGVAQLAEQVARIVARPPAASITSIPRLSIVISRRRCFIFRRPRYRCERVFTPMRRQC